MAQEIYIQLLLPLDMGSGDGPHFPKEIKVEIVKSVAILLIEILAVEEGKEGANDLS